MVPIGVHAGIGRGCGTVYNHFVRAMGHGCGHGTTKGDTALEVFMGVEEEELLLWEGQSSWEGGTCTCTCVTGHEA